MCREAKQTYNTSDILPPQPHTETDIMILDYAALVQKFLLSGPVLLDSVTKIYGETIWLKLYV